MSIQLQLRRGTTAEHLVFTGANGELTINTTTKRPHIHDGSTAGGAPLALLSDITNVVPKTEVQSVLYTLARNDVYVRAFNTAAQTITVPNNESVAYPIGTQITIVQVGTGATTLAPGTGVVLNYGDTLTCRKQWSAVTITKVATNVWDVIGDVRIN